MQINPKLVRGVMLTVGLQGGPRYDPAGQPRGAVTPAQQERARQELAAGPAKRRGQAGRTPRWPCTPDRPTPTPDGEQTVTYGTAEPLYEKE